MIDPKCGSLHESNGKRSIGPPKHRPRHGRSSCRRSWSPCCATTLPAIPTSTCSPRPAVRGCGARRSTAGSSGQPSMATAATPGAAIRTDPVKPGLTFHGLRHSHKTWLIKDAVPEIGRSRRLGHHLADRVVETYSHVAAGVEKRILTRLEHRWRVALATVRPTRSHTPDDRRRGGGKKARRANKTRRRSMAGSGQRPHGRPTPGPAPVARASDARAVARTASRDVHAAQKQPC